MGMSYSVCCEYYGELSLFNPLVSMMAIYIPEEDRSYDILELIENKDLLQ